MQQVSDGNRKLYANPLWTSGSNWWSKESLRAPNLIYIRLLYGYSITWSQIVGLTGTPWVTFIFDDHL